MAAVFAGLSLFVVARAAAEPADVSFYEKKIRPVFVEHCYKCHSAEAEKVKGGLRVDNRDALLKGGETGPALVPGKPDESLLIKAIRYGDPDLKMPPKDKKLSEVQIADITTWVASGAVMPAVTNALVAKYDFSAAKTNWAFRKPIDSPVPKVRDTKAIKSPLDNFILAKIENAKFRPAPLADKRTLLRRATYDLTGLPPTPADIEAFLKDTSPNAFSKVVERLLASPRYGEKWARHWLDVVRYTDSLDSRGIGSAGDISEAWRYRDWVVNAFNNDLPYNQFIVQQLAGDILATNVPGKFETNELIATGVYAIGEWGAGDADKEKLLTDVVDDQIDVTARGFLGLTVACARCHDHKFDPIPTDDYYGLAGIFFSSHILPNPGVKTEGSPVSRIPLAPPSELAARQRKEKRTAELEKEIAASSSVTLMAKSKRGELNQTTLSSLHPPNGDLPNVIANSGDAAISFITITLPPRSVAIHPSPDKNAAAVWQSPITGEIELSGRIADADDKCGNGIEWRLFRGTNLLESGKFDNGKSQAISSTNTTVKAGELITLMVMPRGKDHSCDTTVIELEIHQRGGEGVWRLPQDVVADLPAWANTGAWYFVVCGDAPPSTLNSNLSDEEKSRLENARGELASLRKEIERKIPIAHGLQEGGVPKSVYEGVHDSHIMVRGKYDRLGEIVPRHFPRVIAETQPPIAKGSGRLELAHWIASKDNPLTARVMVNRIWQHHFGEGIVRTSNNFGKLGTPPTHPELLDWFAHRFVDSGWSIKAMHRLMMNSATYQQASFVESRESKVESQSDSENKLFARMSRRRLEAEEIRDALLAVSGQLDFTMSGPAVNDINTKRRTLYVMTVRSDKSNYRSLFDAPDAQTIAEKRLDSTVAPQALFLLNSPFALAQAKALAERALKREAKEDSERIQWLYVLLYGREPQPREVEIGSKVLASDESRAAAWERYCQVLLCANEFVFVD